MLTKNIHYIQLIIYSYLQKERASLIMVVDISIPIHTYGFKSKSGQVHNEHILHIFLMLIKNNRNVYFGYLYFLKHILCCQHCQLFCNSIFMNNNDNILFQNNLLTPIFRYIIRYWLTYFKHTNDIHGCLNLLLVCYIIMITNTVSIIISDNDGPIHFNP